MSRYRDEPPRDGDEERRDGVGRRDEDTETHEIVEHAVHDAPLVRRLLGGMRTVVAAIGFGTAVGGVSVALGYRVIGPREDVAALKHQLEPRIDTNAAKITRLGLRVDSLLTVAARADKNAEISAFIQCIQARRHDPDIRPSGCDDTERRSKQP